MSKNYASIQLDGEGKEVAEDELRELRANTNDVTAANINTGFKASVNVGGEQAVEAAKKQAEADFVNRVDAFEEELNRLLATKQAGRTVGPSTLERLMGELSDITIQHGDDSDPTLIAYRQIIDDLSRK